MNVLNFNNKYMMSIVFLCVLSITIISAAFNENLIIDGEAYVRVDADIRVSDLDMTSVTNGAYELYNAKYSKNTVTIYPYLTNLDSTITYQITITNKSSDIYLISNIEDTNSNSNIEYTIDYNVGELINGNTTRVITITYKYKDSVTTLPSEKTTISNIEFTFEQPTATMLAYDNTNTGIECDNVQCAIDYIKSLKISKKQCGN